MYIVGRIFDLLKDEEKRTMLELEANKRYLSDIEIDFLEIKIGKTLITIGQTKIYYLED